eukprot:SM000299S10838  [mRNA]  locus=s299:18457:21441:+ [translate_table: standard]
MVRLRRVIATSGGGTRLRLASGAAAGQAAHAAVNRAEACSLVATSRAHFRECEVLIPVGAKRPRGSGTVHNGRSSEAFSSLQPASLHSHSPEPVRKRWPGGPAATITPAKRKATSARCRLRGCGSAALGWPSASVLERTRVTRTGACDHTAKGWLAATSRTGGSRRSRKPRRLGEAVLSNEATRSSAGLKWVNLTKLVSKDVPCQTGKYNPHHDKYSFIHSDGTRTWNAVDLALLLKGKKVGVLSDSLSGQVFIHVLSSLQKHGLGDYASYGNITYFYDLKGIVRRKCLPRALHKSGGTRPSPPGRSRLCWEDLRMRLGHTSEVWSSGSNQPWLSQALLSYHIVPSIHDWNGLNIYPSQIQYAFLEYNIIIMNLGMHYHNFMVKGLRHDLNTVADLLAAFNNQKNRVGFFREAFPQHFFSVTGFGSFPHPEGYPANISVDSSKRLPDPRVHQHKGHKANQLEQLLGLTDARVAMCRNDVLWEVAMQKSVPVQHVFYQMDMHGFHKTDTPRLDCTHSGNRDTWWLPVFDTFYTTVAADMCRWAMLPESDYENHFTPGEISTTHFPQPALEGDTRMSSWDLQRQE